MSCRSSGANALPANEAGVEFSCGLAEMAFFRAHRSSWMTIQGSECLFHSVTPEFSSHISCEKHLCIPQHIVYLCKKPFMNKLYRLPLRTRTKNLSSGVRRRQNSSKILATGILALCAIAALVAIGFAAFLTYKHVRGKPKVIATVSPTPAATPVDKSKNVLMPLSDPNKAPSDGTASARSAVIPQPSPSVLNSTPVATTPSSTPVAAAAQHEQKTEAQATDKPLTKAARKILEKKRLEAEHKRAQLEKMYQNHEISTDTYNKGKEEYKAEIQKYRDGLKSGQ
jgi:hypothetical protein